MFSLAKTNTKSLILSEPTVGLFIVRIAYEGPLDLIGIRTDQKKKQEVATQNFISHRKRLQDNFKQVRDDDDDKHRDDFKTTKLKYFQNEQLKDERRNGFKQHQGLSSLSDGTVVRERSSPRRKQLQLVLHS